MLRPETEIWRTQEELIAAAVLDVVSEIRLIDLTDLVCYFRLDRMQPVNALIASALELYFKPDTLVFTGIGSAHAGWNGKIRVTLDFELRHDGLSILFSIVMHASSAAIQINFVSLDGNANPVKSERLIARTAAALAEVRIRPIGTRLPWCKAARDGASGLVPAADRQAIWNAATVRGPIDRP